MSRGSLCRKRRDVWLRDEVGIRAGQAASSSPAGLWGLGKSGGRPRPQLLCKPTWLLEQGHPPNKRSDLSYKGPQGCTVVLNRRKRITHFSPPPPPPVSQPGHGGGGGSVRSQATQTRECGLAAGTLLCTPMLPAPGWRPPRADSLSVPSFCGERGLPER